MVTAPACGQSFRYGMADLPASRGSPYSIYQPAGTMIWAAIFDALTVLDERGRLEPGLAIS